MSRRALGSLVLLASVIASTVLWWVAVPRADAQSAPVTVTVDQVGWWTNRVGATAPEDDDFEVAASPTGEQQSVAAVQFTINATSVDSFSLTLVETAGFSEFGSVAVCRTVTPWTAENAGDLEEAPTPDCSVKVNLTRTIDSGQWLGNVGQLVSDGGTVSLMFLPEYTPPVPVGPGMVVTIGEIEVEATGSTAPATTTSTTALFPSQPDPSAGIDVSPPTTVAPVGPTTPDVALGPDPALPESNLAAEPPPTATEDVDEFFSLDPLDEASSDSKPWIRLVILVPLSALVGYGAARGRQFVADRSTRFSGAPS